MNRKYAGTAKLGPLLLVVLLGGCLSSNPPPPAPNAVATVRPVPQSATQSPARCVSVLDCAQQAVEAAQAAQLAAEQSTAQLRATMVGAVVAFNATTCPTGWTEYTPAQGRFIRGIDKPGGATDPDGRRAPGTLQGDMIGSHAHNVRNMPQGNYGGGDSDRGDHLGAFSTRATDPSGGPETRPKNVALLYCITS